MRTFIAIPLPDAIAARAGAILRPQRALRLVGPDQLHVTLAFLGDLPPARRDDVGIAIAEASHGQTPFALRLDHLGRFPEAGPPRILWLGVGEGREPLLALGEAVRRSLRERAVAFDEKPLQAHVTLARVREDADRDEVRTIAQALRVPVEPLVVDVREVVAFESVIGRDGPRYTARHSAILDGVG